MAMTKTLLVLFFFLCGVFAHGEEAPSNGLVRKENRKVLDISESGSISAVDVKDGSRGGSYRLQFITMEPGSLFLPVLLHSDMVFYVHTGRGSINYVEEGSNEDSEDENKKKQKSGGTKSFDVERGDVSRIKEGTTFYIRSYPAQTREKLRIYAIFDTINYPEEQFFGPYSNITDLVRGFDERILQMGFGVSEELIQSIKQAEKSPPIVPDIKRNQTKEEEDEVKNNLNWKEGIIESMVGREPIDYLNKKKKKSKGEDRAFNFRLEKKDFENCYGWSTAVTHKDLKALKRSEIGAFMVNLTTGSMMGPHWNPRATEISIVTHGQGMVQIICPTNPSGQETESESACQDSFFRVSEGDVFVVPKYHPMAQIAFNNDSFVFVGFSTNSRSNYPQFLAGGRSVLQVIDREVLARGFNVGNESVVDELLSKQSESIILECTSCAEDLVERVEKEERREEERREEKRREEEARAREEEARAREEERKRQEERRRQKEEEERRAREKEEREREERRRQRKEEERERETRTEEEREREERRQQEEEEEERETRTEEEEGEREERRQQEEEERERRRQQEHEEEERGQQEEEEREREERRRQQEQEEEERETRRTEEEEEEEEERRREEEGEWAQGRKLWRMPNKSFNC